MRIVFAAVTASSLLLGLGACSTEPKDEAAKHELSREASASLSSFRSADSSLNDAINRAVGYAIFPNVGKGGLIVGGAYGRGEVYEGGKMIGYADMTQGTIGLQAGGQSYDELILFMTQDTMSNFKKGKFEVSANASAVAVKAGAAAAADYSKGVVIFTQTKGGLMAEASVGGQKFDFKPL